MPEKTIEPSIVELSGSTDGRDITRPYISKLQLPQDAVLIGRGGGDLKIYDELLTDDQIYSTFQQRRMALVGKEWGVTAHSDAPEDVSAADFVREVFQTLNFDNITEKAMYSIFYGYGVGEYIWNTEGNRWGLEDIKMRDRKRFRFGKGGELYLLTRDNPTGELMPPEKFWIMTTGATHDDAPYGLGLAHYAYWPTFFKRNGLKFWLKFLEKFGTPSVIAKAPKAITDSKAETAKVLQALRSIQQDSAVLIPDGIVVELLQATGTGTVDHESLKRSMDKAIAKIILSQTMTSDGEGGQYKGEMLKEVRDEVIAADADLISESLNRGIIKTLTEVNFPNANPPKIWRDVEVKEDMNKRVERDEKIYGMGFEPSQEYIDETYGEGWEKKAVPDPAEPSPLLPAAEFAELNSRLTMSKIENRSDQAAIADAARKFANDYQGVVGGRIEELTAILEETGDLATFKERITELMSEAPPKEMVESIEKATFYTRMMGVFRNQK